MLKQLILQVGLCPDDILRFYRQTPGRAPSSIPNPRILRQCIVDLCQKHHVFLLLDALDESLNSTKIADLVLGLLRESSEIRILITSRDDANLEETLSKAGRIRFEDYTSKIAHDIGKYVADTLQTNRRLLSLPQNVQDDIADSLNAKSGGM
jgi:hypothetical protein